MMRQLRIENDWTIMLDIVRKNYIPVIVKTCQKRNLGVHTNGASDEATTNMRAPFGQSKPRFNRIPNFPRIFLYRFPNQQMPNLEEFPN